MRTSRRAAAAARMDRLGCRGQARFGGHLQALDGEGEVADDPVVEAFGPGVVVAHVVGALAGAELVAASAQLAVISAVAPAGLSLRRRAVELADVRESF
jgi:hypothetical protein